MAEGLRAAAASLAIMGEMRPLLAEILSMMEAGGTGTEVAAVAEPESPPPEAASAGVSGTVAGPEDIFPRRPGAPTGRAGVPRLGNRGKKGEPGARPELERARARGMEPGRPWDNSPEILLLGGLAALGVASVVVAAAAREAEDCWLVGEALRLEFLLLRAEKSTKSSLLDSSCSVSLAPSTPAGSPSTPAVRTWRRSCLRLCEVIWLVEVKVKPQPARMQWKWLVALLYTQPSYLHSSYL